MKRKLITYIIISIILVLIIFGFSFFKIIQYKNRDNMISYLRANNASVLSKISDNEIAKGESFLKLNNCFEGEMRITILDYANKVIYDSWSKDFNYQGEETETEISMAFQEGEGIEFRQSHLNNEDMVFLANRDTKTGYIVRSAISMKYVDVVDNKFVESVIVLSVVVLIISLWISNKLTYVIVEPIKYLDDITSRFSKGELNRRSILRRNDEIGSLSDKFNNMAYSIEKNINDITYNKNRLEAIMNSMNSGVIAVDRAQKIISINPCAETMLGIKENILGKSIKNEVTNDNVLNIFNNIEDEKEIVIEFPIEKVLRVKNTDIINKSDYIGNVAVIEDITDIKQLDNMRMQFVSNVSHELKTPLTSIIGFSQTLKTVEDPELRNRFLGIINKEAERLTSLIEDILTLSSLEGNIDINSEKFKINTVVEEVIAILQNQSYSKNIEIIKNGNISYVLCGDRNKFKQMMINLVDNAIKYSNENGKIIISCEDGAGAFRISVKDNGIGISKENLKFIFQRFYRVSKSRSRESGGTGLGLAIVKHIAMVFNGKIEVCSKLGEGSEFIINIPKGN